MTIVSWFSCNWQRERRKRLGYVQLSSTVCARGAAFKARERLSSWLHLRLPAFVSHRSPPVAPNIFFRLLLISRSQLSLFPYPFLQSSIASRRLLWKYWLPCGQLCCIFTLSFVAAVVCIATLDNFSSLYCGVISPAFVGLYLVMAIFWTVRVCVRSSVWLSRKSAQSSYLVFNLSIYLTLLVNLLLGSLHKCRLTLIIPQRLLRIEFAAIVLFLSASCVLVPHWSTRMV